ncbi:MAG: HRDC domain-containing protein [Corynebacterium sp.]|uniref:HRDC domain-containing protein n=1 Tax=Corynebacterium sp. TaxID=1720 RepID=UPI0026DAA0BA|nr:HRDC domain-containing protein [Corynebacterium sp.]MDO5099163.1 HRDC domain-containing protein [Corynebacterium sp.]
MSAPLLSPRDGTPPVANTPAKIHSAAKKLRNGSGRFAIDTERASGFRYDDRAFLIQIRRSGSGTHLIDPENNSQSVIEHCAPVLNNQTWVMHAAVSDLPCLAELQLFPGGLFDTEIAGRLLGFERVNLASMVSHFLGFELRKEHGFQDWSARPLPQSWLTYAALDVELLIELADAQHEKLRCEGKLEWAQQEFAHIVSTCASAPVSAPRWQDVKGLTALKTPKQLVIAQALWMHREHIAQKRDRARQIVLPDKALIAIAQVAPRTVLSLCEIPSVPRRLHRSAHHWVAVVRAALKSPRATWPTSIKDPHDADTMVASHYWAQLYPEAHQILRDIRADFREIAEVAAVPVENIFQPAALKQIVWWHSQESPITSDVELRKALRRLQVRPWQQELCQQVLLDHLL